ncbi:hypothetical protein ACL02S_23185 [Nocardia sp. 004]|uniref:hypothetical protein n=1 Tax=Nocardia sp. 004 TaxID=3385978 RepID=UPI0039A3D384
MSLNLASSPQPADKLEPFISLEQVVQWGGYRLTPSEVERLRRNIRTSTIPEVISEVVGGIVDDRTRVLAENLSSCLAPAELRGSLAAGHTPEKANAILGQISDLAGVRVICVWDHIDADGFGGHSNFYIEDNEDETILELSGDLRAWLTENPDSPDCPATSGNPSTWFGSAAAELTAEDIAHNDGLLNYALHDLR